MSNLNIGRGGQTGSIRLAITQVAVTVMTGTLAVVVLLNGAVGRTADQPDLPDQEVQSGRPASVLEAGDAVYRATLPDVELAQMRAATDTPAERQQVNEVLAAAFADVAEVKIAGPQNEANDEASGGGSVQQVLAYGAAGTHVWMTASYADMAAGAIWAAVRFCQRRYPPLSGVCGYVGNLLTSWARGWGAASNHGVWGAVYYWGQVTGGRW